MLSRFDRALEASARIYLGLAAPSQLVEFLSGDLNHQELFNLAFSEGLRGILAQQIMDISGAGADPLCRQVAAEEFLWNASYLALMQRLDQGFTRRGIQTIVLKGMSLIPLSYNGQVGLRAVSDIDLLIRPRDRAEVEDQLRVEGFEPLPGFPGNFRDQSGRQVDLHVNPFNQLGSAFLVEEDLLWSESVPVPFYGSSTRALGAEYQFLQLAVHAAKHGYRRLVWLVDLATILPHVDADRLAKVARGAGGLRVLDYTDWVLRMVLRIEALPTICKDQKPFSWLEKPYLDAARLRKAPPLLGMLVPGLSVPGYRHKMRYLLQVLFPRRTSFRSRCQRLAQLTIDLFGFLWRPPHR